MEASIAKDLSKLATEFRRKADYLRLLPAGDYMQESASDALVGAALEIEKLVAKYFIFYGLLKDEKMQEIISRQCRHAIKMAIARENATLE